MPRPSLPDLSPTEVVELIDAHLSSGPKIPVASLGRYTARQASTQLRCQCQWPELAC